MAPPGGLGDKRCSNLLAHFLFVQDQTFENMAEVMTTYQGKSLKDVPAEAFIKAFSAYLKSTGKVSAAAVIPGPSAAAVWALWSWNRAPGGWA